VSLAESEHYLACTITVSSRGSLHGLYLSFVLIQANTKEPQGNGELGPKF